MKVPWLAKQTIADIADDLITDYQCTVDCTTVPPIPVEDIIERALGLNLGFFDLRTRLDLNDVLGATYVNKRLICIDESLVNQRCNGRLFFTCAHEAGHWVLHRNIVSEARRGAWIFCRVRDANRPLEWQADYFASCLLMPESFVRPAFECVYGARPLVLYKLKSAFCGPICFDPAVETWPQIAREVMHAGGFSNVSKQAMIIRLQDLGLVQNETGVRLNWDAAVAMA